MYWQQLLCRKRLLVLKHAALVRPAIKSVHAQTGQAEVLSGPEDYSQADQSANVWLVLFLMRSCCRDKYARVFCAKKCTRVAGVFLSWQC
jgi:hypothetical protein